MASLPQSSIDVIGLGELLWDCFPAGKKPGGAPANVAFHAQQLGLSARVATRVGQDSLGDELCTFLTQQGLQTDLVQRDPDHGTGTVTIAPQPDGSARYTFLENSAWDFLAFDPRWQTDMREARAVCFGTLALPQNHPDRYAAYALNTVLGGSMSSRLFQNVREKRGLAYAVFSNLSAYRDAGSLTVYAGCANEAVREVVRLVVDELRGMKVEPPEAELRRAKDHLKGSLMLSLESTSSRMSNLARQEMYFDRQFSLDETIESIEQVNAGDVVRVARDLFANGSLGATVLGHTDGLELSREELDLG